MFSIQWEVSQNEAVYLTATDMNCPSQIKRAHSNSWYKLSREITAKDPSTENEPLLCFLNFQMVGHIFMLSFNQKYLKYLIRKFISVHLYASLSQEIILD